MTDGETRDLESIHERMTRRERVLRDQADSLRDAFGRTVRSPLAVIDIESNGLAHLTYPIEVGYAIGSGMEPSIIGSMLVRPRPSWDAAAAGNAKSINGIDPEDLKDAMDADEVCDILDRLLSGRSVICDGGEYDSYWMSRLYGGRTPDFNLRAPEAEQAEAIARMRSSASLVHRAGPDAVWLYRAIRINRSDT